MTTIKQALDVLCKAGSDVTVYEDAFSYKTTITIEIPFGTSWLEEIEGTSKILDAHYDPCRQVLNTTYGLSSSQAERASNTFDLYATALKHFQNRSVGTYKIPEVREIRYNGPATIVFWEDNTKTVVKVQPGEECYDPDKAFVMAVCKKLFGNKFNRHLTKAQKAFEKFCEDEYEKEHK